MPNVINMEHTQGYTKPGYAQLAGYQGRLVLIMGNSVQTRRDGTEWVWTADWATGERCNATVRDLSPTDDAQPDLVVVVRKVESWAKDGNGDAMWWLGNFYEFGSAATGANGGKALAYYLGAIRREPDCYDRGTVERVLHDGCTLFKANHPDGVIDATPSDAKTFLSRFREYREFASHRHVYFPDVWDWAECVRIAEALPNQGAAAAAS